MNIEFTWWQLLILGVVVMTLAWTIVVSRRCTPVFEEADAVPTGCERFFWIFIAGMISGSLLAYGIGALLPTYVNLDFNP